MTIFTEREHSTEIYLCDSCSGTLPCILTVHDANLKPCSCPFTEQGEKSVMAPNWRILSPKLDEPNVGEEDEND